ncbi:hypothetical protein HAX54_014489, partial [Datura stramonium]|nr:hypothetical protein [Datura stramonium]
HARQEQHWRKARCGAAAACAYCQVRGAFILELYTMRCETTYGTIGHVRHPAYMRDGMHATTLLSAHSHARSGSLPARGTLLCCRWQGRCD